MAIGLFHHAGEGLETIVDQVEQALKEASASPYAQKMRGEAKKAAASFRSATEQTWQEVCPHLLSALKQQADAEMQKMIDRLKQEETASEVPAAEVAPDEPDSE